MPKVAGIYYFVSNPQSPPANALPPIVLVHGAGGNHLYWPPQVRRIPNLTVLAVDLPAHGKSDGIAEQEISAYARQLRHWASAISLKKALWVGHSMGGAIVLTLALEHSELVAGLGLVSTAARLPVSPRLLDATAHPATFSTAVDTIIKWAFSPQAPANLRNQAAKRMLEMRPSVLHNDLAACNVFNVADRLGEITMPALVLHGTADKMVPLHEGEFLARALPNATLQTFPQAGHMLMLERPHEVTEALRTFVLKHWQGNT